MIQDFLKDNLHKYKVYKNNIFFSTEEHLPQITRRRMDPLCKWYVDGIGMVPRWSRWSRVIDNWKRFLESRKTAQ